MKNVLRKVTALVLSLMLMLGAATPALAEGSKQIAGDSTNNLAAYRPFTEWSTTEKTAGVLRQQVIYVYAFKGETINFGSSICDSCLNVDLTGKSYKTNDVTGVDIAVIDKYGKVSTYDVVKNGTGYIGTRAQELAGPSTVADGGYKPLSFVAEYDGVYEFHFHSYTGTLYSGYKATVGDSSGSINTQYANSHSTGGSIAFWDITVVGDDGRTVKDGRAYTNYLTLSLGNNFQNMFSNLFVLTDDGYLYDLSFNGFAPYGFILFANNRGLTSASTNQSIYHSVATNDNTMATLKSLFNTTFHSPSARDTAVDKTYKIFFNKPSDDLVGTSIYPEVAKVPSKAKNLKFYGWSNKEGVTDYEHGGYFSFVVTNASSAVIKLDMSSIGGGIVELSNAVVEGENIIEWNGKDAYGNFLEPGEYSLKNIEITLQTKAGEVHFPFFDAEQCTGGIRITRINDVYDETGSYIVDKYDPNNAESYSERSTIYYNNLPVIDGKVTADSVPVISKRSNNVYGYDTGDGSYSYAYTQNGTSSKYCYASAAPYLNDITYTVLDKNTADQSKGIDSSDGKALVYDFNNKRDCSGLNMCAVDVWAFYGGASTTTKTNCTLSVVAPVPEQPPVGAVTGFVFYDDDNNGKYINDYTEDDYPLDDIVVQLVDGNNEIVAQTTTDAFGKYRFYNVNAGDYSVKVNRPFDSYVITTKNASQSVTVSGGQTTVAANVGFYYKSIDTKVTVAKYWNGDNDTIEDQVIAKLFAKYKDNNGNIQYINAGLEATLSDANGWHNTFSNMPMYFIEKGVEHELRYFIKEYYLNEETGETELVGTSLSGANDFDPTYENTATDTSEYVSSYFYTTVSNTETRIEITNTSKKITASVNANIKYIRSNSASPDKENFYVALFTKNNEKGYTLQSTVKKVAVNAETTNAAGTGTNIQFGEVPFGTYYIFEVDEDGTILTDSEYYSNYKVLYPKGYELTLTKEENEKTAEIENYDDYKIVFVSNRSTDVGDDVYGFVWASDLKNGANPLSIVNGTPTADNCEFFGWNTSKAGNGTYLKNTTPYTLPGKDTYFYGVWGAKGSFYYYTEIRYAEPWGLRLTALLKFNGAYVDKTKYEDYGVYVYNLDENAPVPSKLDMLEKSNYYGKGDKIETTKKLNGYNFIAFDYAKQIYTYQLNRNIFVMFYVKYNGIEYYGSVKNRNLYNSYESIAQTGTAGQSQFNSNQMLLSSSIVTMYDAVSESYDGGAGEYPDAGTVEPDKFQNIAENTDYKIKVGTAIRSYEPWGLKLSASVTDNYGNKVDLNTLEDYGVVVYHDKESLFSNKVSPEDLINQDDSSVYSMVDKSVEATAVNAFSVYYTKGIYTYQLQTNIYFAYYVKQDGVYYFNNVTSRNLYSLTNGFANLLDPDDTIFGIINAMLGLFKETYYYKFKEYPSIFH